ncbi:MAG: hypothetical protein KF749_14265 [Bacteroidetes bacterium]|nr:hypothetical protein [Bacteroidota bacterium]MCW5894084.1 hypothetical protein [Bacteroidota bacterium]
MRRIVLILTKYRGAAAHVLAQILQWFSYNPEAEEMRSRSGEDQSHV